MSIFNKFKLESEKFKIRGYTTKNPDGEWIQELLGEIKRSGLKSINISPCERGAAGELYVYANGHIIGSILKKRPSTRRGIAKNFKKDRVVNYNNR